MITTKSVTASDLEVVPSDDLVTPMHSSDFFLGVDDTLLEQTEVETMSQLASIPSTTIPPFENENENPSLSTFNLNVTSTSVGNETTPEPPKTIFKSKDPPVPVPRPPTLPHDSRFDDRIALHQWVTLNRLSISTRFKSPFPNNFGIPEYNKPDVYLSNPICMRFLVQFLSAEYAAENFRFLYQVELLKGMTDKTRLEKSIISIFNSFISPKTANFEINIPNSVRNNISTTLQEYTDYIAYVKSKNNASKTLETKKNIVVESLIFNSLTPEPEPPSPVVLDPSIYDEARETIYNLIKTDSLARFIKGPKFPELLVELASVYRTRRDQTFISLNDFPTNNPLDNLYPGTGTVVVDISNKQFRRKPTETGSSSGSSSGSERKLHRSRKSISDFSQLFKGTKKSENKITNDLLHHGRHNLRSASISATLHSVPKPKPAPKRRTKRFFTLGKRKSQRALPGHSDPGALDDFEPVGPGNNNATPSSTMGDDDFVIISSPSTTSSTPKESHP